VTQTTFVLCMPVGVYAKRPVVNHGKPGLYAGRRMLRSESRKSRQGPRRTL